MKKSAGFSVIEVLIAIVVIAIIGGVIWVRGMRANADIVVSTSTPGAPIAIGNVKLLNKTGRPVHTVKPGETIYATYVVAVPTKMVPPPSSNYQPVSGVSVISLYSSSQSMFLDAKETGRSVSGTNTMIKYRSDITADESDPIPGNLFTVSVSACAYADNVTKRLACGSYPTGATSFIINPAQFDI